MSGSDISREDDASCSCMRVHDCVEWDLRRRRREERREGGEEKRRKKRKERPGHPTPKESVFTASQRRAVSTKEGKKQQRDGAGKGLTQGFVGK